MAVTLGGCATPKEIQSAQREPKVVNSIRKEAKRKHKDSEITVALISPVCQIGDPEANLRHFETWIRKAVDKGAEFVGFPEYALTGWGPDPALKDLATPIPGPWTRRLEEIAARENIYISMGMIEKAGETNYNVQVLVGPKGYIGHYRKHDPIGSEGKYAAISPGKEFPVFEMGKIKLGFNICADSRNIETIESLALNGVQFVHTPHANKMQYGRTAEQWTRGKLVYYLERTLKSRSHILVNTMAGQVTDRFGKINQFSSGAMIIDPLGQVVARTMQNDNEEKMLIATIDTDLTRYIPRWEARRPPLSEIPRVKSEISFVKRPAVRPKKGKRVEP